MAESQKHIVMLNKGYPPWVGGIERHVGDISEALAQRGWRVSALVCNTANYSTEEEIKGVSIIRVRSRGQLFSQPLTTGYRKQLKALKPDLVHVHAPFPLAWSAVKGLDQNIPVVCTWHSDIVRQRLFRPVYAPFEQRFLDRCARIVPTSDVLLQSSQSLKKHEGKCESVPLALPDQPVLSDEILQEQAILFKKRFSTPLVLFVGRLVSYKGLPYLIKAMKQVNATLLIAGEGSEQSKLERLTQKLKLENKIKFLGYVSNEEKEILYRTCDLFVLPSIGRNEAFGYVLLEAMRNGCPVITTQLNTGVQFVNQHEQTGLVVPKKNPNALADAINHILTNDAFQRHYGQLAKQRIESYFNFNSTIDQIEKIYQDLLENNILAK